MARRPTEVKLVADLLSYEAESVDELAAAVIDALDRDRRKRDHFVIRVTMADLSFGIGPYATRGEAVRAARLMHPDAPDEQIQRAVARLIPPSILEEDETAPKLGSYCQDCEHPMVTHDWPKSRIAGCVVAGCMCGKPTAPPV